MSFFRHPSGLALAGQVVQAAQAVAEEWLLRDFSGKRAFGFFWMLHASECGHRRGRRSTGSTSCRLRRRLGRARNASWHLADSVPAAFKMMHHSFWSMALVGIFEACVCVPDPVHASWVFTLVSKRFSPFSCSMAEQRCRQDHGHAEDEVNAYELLRMC